VLNLENYGFLILFAVSMKVQYQLDLPLDVKLLDRLPSSMDAWVAYPAGLAPTAIYVHSTEVASVVAVDYSVRVEHRKASKDELSTQILSLKCVSY
jgi:hypothetical protein